MIQVAEALAPCILWIDEIDKSFLGSAAKAMPEPAASLALSSPG